MSALTPWDPFRELDELQNRLATMSDEYPSDRAPVPATKP
jgi:HSP20 family protein